MKTSAHMEGVKQQIFKISRLIFEDIAGTISDENRHELEQWRTAHPDNESLYRQLRDEQRLSAGVQQMQRVDILRPLEDMHLRILQEERKRRKLRLQWIASAAAVVTLFLGSFYLFRTDTPQPIVVEQQTIVAGSARAILRLDNGRVVDLDTLTRQFRQGDINIVKTDSRQLSYARQEASVKSEATPIYNEIEVPRGGEFDLVLSDGSVVWLNAESKLRFPVEFTGTERRVFLEGEAYFKVEKNAGMPFRVEIRNQTVEVLGTEFNIAGYEDEGNVYTTLVTGKVKVATATGAMDLVPGEQSIFDCTSGHIDVQKVDIEKVVSWKKGMFILEEQTLEQIMHKFARWYDISVFYQNSDLKQIVFKGVVPRYAELQDVLKILEKTNEVKFNVQNRTVIVSR